MASKKVIVVGGGLSGLSAGALLARRGFDVTILEKQARPGGVAGQYKSKGFSFDMGPSWYLMPEVFERFFGLFGKRPDNFFDLIRLDPYYKAFFENGETAEVTPDIKATYDLFDRLEHNGGEKLKRYLDLAKYKYDVAIGEFLYRDYARLSDFFNRRILVEGLRLHIFQKLDRYISRFFSDDRAKKLLEYNIVFLGCSPYKSPALYSLMSYVDLCLGVYYPRGGMYNLATALERLARENGAHISYGREVNKISVSGNRATSVVTQHETHEADVVLVGADYHHAETQLLDHASRSYPEAYWSRKLLAPSAFIMYLGVEKKLPGLQHHNLFLARDWDRHFGSIFDRPSWPDNPSYYVACPSKTDTTVAPPGGENVFVLVPVAPGIADSDGVREAFADKIIRHLEGLIQTRFSDTLSVKRIFSQRDFSQQFNLYRGTAMGMAHTLWQTAFFRPSHTSKKVLNLYYTSHYTHPGIGLPMVLISSQIVCDTIIRDCV